MKMFSAIAKLFRTIGYILTGNLNKISSVWAKKQVVIEAKFDSIIGEKKKNIQSYKEAVGSLIANQERKKNMLRQLTDEAAKLERLRQAAQAKGALIASGKTKEEVKSNPDYVKCSSAYRDFSTTLEEKQKRIVDLESDVKEIDHQLAQHKAQIETQMRDLEKVKDEKYETKAAIAASEEKRKIADLFSGISEDRTNKELQELRELRHQADANARVSSELTGLSAKRTEDEFLEFAAQSVIDDEFDRLIGLARESTPSETQQTDQKVAE